MADGGWQMALFAIGYLLSAISLGACGPSTPASAVATDWVAAPMAALPVTLDVDDARWDAARPAYFPLHQGSHGPLTDRVVELRALYDVTRIVFRARWHGPAVGLEEPLFALVWHKDTLPDQRGETCYAVCHNALGDGRGNLSGVVLSVVPARADPPMPSRAAQRNGMWTLTYSRPLIADNALDVQFVDRSLSYPVRARVWRGNSDGPDWLSESYSLRFQDPNKN
ncbi:MAG: hypothetical protein ABI874_01920 [Chloroflexota bacterium]